MRKNVDGERLFTTEVEDNLSTEIMDLLSYYESRIFAEARSIQPGEKIILMAVTIELDEQQNLIMSLQDKVTNQQRKVNLEAAND